MPHDGKNEEPLDAPYYIPVADNTTSSEEYINQERQKRLHDQLTDYSQDRDPVRIGPLEFQYEQPDVSVDSGTRTARHKIIDGDVVIQRLGQKPDKITVKGVCWPTEANVIDTLPDRGEISMRSERWSGTVMVLDTGTDPMGAKDADGRWLYNYSLQLIEAGSGRADKDSMIGSSPGGDGSYLTQE